MNSIYNSHIEDEMFCHNVRIFFTSNSLDVWRNHKHLRLNTEVEIMICL